MSMSIRAARPIKVWLDPVAMAGNTGFLADASPAVCEVDGGDMASIGPR